MKKMLLGVVVILALASWTLAQTPEKRFELNLFGGYGFTSVNGTSTYQDVWSAFLFPSITETTVITAKSNNAPFFGAGFNYFFTPNVGLGLNVGYMKSGIDTTADLTFNYGSTETASWPSSGDSLTTIPVSLNVVAHFGEGPLQFFIEGGPTVFFNDAKIDSSIGYGVNWITYAYPYIYSNLDVLQIPMNAYDTTSGKSTWTSFGANVGGGITYMVSPSIGLNLEARYFFCPTRDLTWNLVAGTYNGYFGTSTGWTFGSDDIQYITSNGLIDTIKINPSFFQVLVGLKIIL